MGQRLPSVQPLEVARVLAADEAVIEAVATVFRRFAELGSARPGDAVATRGRVAPSTATGPHRADSVGDGHLPGMHYFLTNPC